MYERTLYEYICKNNFISIYPNSSEKCILKISVYVSHYWYFYNSHR